MVCLHVKCIFCLLMCSFAESTSPLKEFLLQTAKMSPEEKAAFLEKDEVVK